MEKNNQPVVSNEKKDIRGFNTSDIFGIVLMIIPFLISIYFKKPVPPKKVFFLTKSKFHS